MRKLSLLLPVFCFLILSLFPHAHGEEKGILIKIATLAPEGSSWTKVLHRLNDEVKKKTDQRIQFRIYAGGVLGDEKDMVRKMKIGQIQAAALTSGGLSGLNKEIDVLQIPFLFRTYEEVDAVLDRMDSSFRKGFEENGYILLGWAEAGFIYLLSTVPISGVSDLKKAKVWTWEDSPMSKAIFDEAGVSAIPLSVPDVLVGLQTGLVQVVYAPPTGAISFQWFTKVKYMTDVPLVYLIGGVVVNKETFKKISPNDQKVLLEEFQHYTDQLKTITRKENREAIQVMAKQGVKIVTPSKEQIEEFKKLSNKAMGHIGGETFSKKVNEEVSFILENLRKGKK